jgi:hypothetical protein
MIDGGGIDSSRVHAVVTQATTTAGSLDGIDPDSGTWLPTAPGSS